MMKEILGMASLKTNFNIFTVSSLQLAFQEDGNNMMNRLFIQVKRTCGTEILIS